HLGGGLPRADHRGPLLPQPLRSAFQGEREAEGPLLSAGPPGDARGAPFSFYHHHPALVAVVEACLAAGHVPSAEEARENPADPPRPGRRPPGCGEPHQTAFILLTVVGLSFMRIL